MYRKTGNWALRETDSSKMEVTKTYYLQALSSLETLSPLCLEEYMRGHGNTRLIMLLEWACLDCKSRHITNSLTTPTNTGH